MPPQNPVKIDRVEIHTYHARKLARHKKTADLMIVI